MTTILDDRRVQYGKVIWARVQKYSVLYSQLYNYLLLYIQLFKENVIFKLHLALIVLPCKKHNVTYI